MGRVKLVISTIRREFETTVVATISRLCIAVSVTDPTHGWSLSEPVVL